MPYKKYIKRGGKVYGPYIYHSKRVDGKVVSEYHGPHAKKLNYKTFLWVFLGVIIITILVLGLSLVGNKISGKAVFDMKVNYKEGEALDGILKLSLKEGELLPASSKLVFENSGGTYEYLLSDVISEETVEGNFYIEGKDISGTGVGYGMQGTKEAYPTVYFTLDIYSIEETKKAEDTPLQNPEETEEPVEEPGITGSVVSFLFGWMSTGKVVMELQTEIAGEVTAETPFTYSLNEGQTAELKSQSVRTSSEELKDNDINLEISDLEVIVTTDYSEKEDGFGEDYLGDMAKTFTIDLENLNMMFNEGDLKVSLIYSEKEIVSLTTVLKDDTNIEIQTPEKTETKVEKAGNTPLQNPEEVPKEVVVVSNILLTDEEKSILIEEFGEINIKTIREEIYNGRLVIGSQLRDYKIEHTYDYPQDIEILKNQIEADRIKWLKDIAATLAKKESVPQVVDIID